MSNILDLQKCFQEEDYTGIFNAIYNVPGMEDLFTQTMSMHLDYLYITERGQKTCSPTAEDVISESGYFDTSSIASLIANLYTVQWHKYLAYTKAEYDPVENYDRKSDITITRVYSDTDSGTNTDKTLAFNSTELKQTGENSTSNTGSGNSTEKTVDRTHGNIGVTTAAQMLEGDSKFWLKFNYYKILFDDVDKVLALSTY